MSTRRVAIGLVVAAALGAAAWWAIAAFMPRVVVDIDPAQLQQRLDARFPQKSCTMMVACLTLSSPVVKLSEGSPGIGLSATVLVALGHRELTGQVAFSGLLHYARYDGDFTLDDIQVDNFSLAGFPPDLVQVVKVRGPDALRRALQGHPLYSLKADPTQAALARLAVRDVRVVDGKVHVTFLAFGA